MGVGSTILIAIICFILAGCTTTLPNGCVVDAASLRYSLIAEQRLDPYTEARLLFVRYRGASVGHMFCVWQEQGEQLAYDPPISTRPTRVPPALQNNPLAVANYLDREVEMATWFPPER